MHFRRCLDAAHGKTESTAVPIERLHLAGNKTHAARKDIAGGVQRRRPVVAKRADGRQGSRLTSAVARSRRSKQSLGGMPERTLRFNE